MNSVHPLVGKRSLWSPVVFFSKALAITWSGACDLPLKVQLFLMFTLVVMVLLSSHRVQWLILLDRRFALDNFQGLLLLQLWLKLGLVMPEGAAVGEVVPGVVADGPWETAVAAAC